MVLNGKQKAAMLLMGLDALTAAELLRGVDAGVVQDLAVELAYLDAAGLCDSEQTKTVAHQFCDLIEREDRFDCQSFLDTLLSRAVGEDKAVEMQQQIKSLLQKRDPFLAIRHADLLTLSTVLQNEHPQVIAVVLSELTPKQSSEVLGSFEEGVQLSTVSRMTDVDAVALEARTRIAEMISERLASFTPSGSGAVARPDQSLRQVAMMLRNLGKDLREGLLESIKGKNPDTADKVVELMVVWEDIVQVSDRSLQQALREIDSQKLALALVKADEAVAEKIKANISERAVAAIEEEMSLMSVPKQEDIDQGRDEIVKIMREMNEKDELRFIEE